MDRGTTTRAVTRLVPVLTGSGGVPSVCVGTNPYRRARSSSLRRASIWTRATASRKGTWLRVTPSPYHDDALIDALAKALVAVWEKLDLPLNRVLAAE